MADQGTTFSSKKEREAWHKLTAAASCWRLTGGMKVVPSVTSSTLVDLTLNRPHSFFFGPLQRFCSHIVLSSISTHYLSSVPNDSDHLNDSIALPSLLHSASLPSLQQSRLCGLLSLRMDSQLRRCFRWRPLSPLSLLLFCLSWFGLTVSAKNAGDYYVRSLPGQPDGQLLQMHAGYVPRIWYKSI